MVRVSFTFFTLLLLSGCAIQPAVEQGGFQLVHFKKSTPNVPCFDRDNEPQQSSVDLHVHPKFYYGKSISYPELMAYFKRAGIKFALLYGIGQTVTFDTACIENNSCHRIIVKPSLLNDVRNSEDYKAFPQDDIHIGLSMSFPNLSEPEKVAQQISYLDEHYPGLFQWMGEVNLLKTNALASGHKPATLSSIAQWQGFMEVLQKRNIPMAIHSDLGDIASPEKHAYLMRAVLKRYPNNKIVWMHMGVSPEALPINVEKHIELMTRLLAEHDNLFLDVSWATLTDSLFASIEQRTKYITFFNQHPKRILVGSDFLAQEGKSFNSYKRTLSSVNQLLSELNDKAFRHIALGQNYFDLTPKMNEIFSAPKICQ